ncbi:MAG: hypothetical protein L6R41_004670, partial [Letrouitia leprolyta]
FGQPDRIRHSQVGQDPKTPAHLTVAHASDYQASRWTHRSQMEHMQVDYALQAPSDSQEEIFKPYDDPVATYEESLNFMMRQGGDHQVVKHKSLVRG